MSEDRRARLKAIAEGQQAELMALATRVVEGWNEGRPDGPIAPDPGQYTADSVRMRCESGPDGVFLVAVARENPWTTDEIQLRRKLFGILPIDPATERYIRSKADRMAEVLADGAIALTCCGAPVACA